MLGVVPRKERIMLPGIVFMLTRVFAWASEASDNLALNKGLLVGASRPIRDYLDELAWRVGNECQRIRISAARKRSSNGNVILESVFTLLPTFAFIFAFHRFRLDDVPLVYAAEFPARGHPLCGDVPDAGRTGPGRFDREASCSSTPWDLSRPPTARSTFLSIITRPPRLTPRLAAEETFPEIWWMSRFKTCLLAG